MGKFAPPDITAANYGIALGPLKGAEKKFKVSPYPSFALGELSFTGQNAFNFVESVPDNLALEDRPSALIAVLRTPLKNTNPTIFSVIGKDSGDVILSGRATFTPPAYAQDQAELLPEGFAVDVVTADATKKFKTIDSVVPVSNDATCLGSKVRLFGLPDLSTFQLIGYRVRLDYDPGVRQPSPTRDGNDESAYVKPGDRPLKSFNITGKIPNQSDGIARYNGVRVTGLAYEEKEDVLVTANEFFMGLIVTARQTHPEGAAAGDDSMLEGTGICKDYALLLAN